MKKVKEKILTEFLYNKQYKHPISDNPMSVNKQLNAMYVFVTNRVHDTNFTIDERLFAIECMRLILEDEL